MPSSRRTPRRRERPRADMESAPTTDGGPAAKRGTVALMVSQTSVGDDACIVPGTLRRRKVPRAGSIPPLRIDFMFWANRGGRAVKTNGCRFPGGRRAGCPHPAAPCGGANTHGRIWNPPLRPTARCAANGKPAAARTPTGGPWPSPTNRGGRLTNRETANPRGVANFCRGRCLHRPGNPAVTQTPAGGYGIRPYDRRRARGQTGNRGANGIANLCRGRCLHCARGRVSEANRTAGPALRPEIVPGTLWQRKHLRAGSIPPLRIIFMFGPTVAGAR